jgi:L-threonylcarbamoyladenylate synthase
MIPNRVPSWRLDDLDELAAAAGVAAVDAVLQAGGVVAIPTESSYGLAALPTSAAGVAAVYRVKQRERGKPLPVVIADVQQLRALGLDPTHPVLAAVAPFWPGPLTVALPFASRDGLTATGASAPHPGKPPAAAGGPSLAVRIPAHAGLLSLLAALGYGLTATSANLSGGEPILDPRQAALLLAGEAAALVVDGGVLPGGPPSTLVAPVACGAGSSIAVRVLRQGGLSTAALRRHLEVVD